MSNKKYNFKSMSNYDKVRLINNSLVLEGLSLKELSKKINIQKKEIIVFMNNEGFTFDEIEGYFRKSDTLSNISKERTLSNLNKESSIDSPSELEDIQSIIDSINQKLNIKEIESTTSLLPEFKNQVTNSNIENEVNKKEIFTLEIPKVSRLERRKKMKKSPFKRFINFLSSLFKPKEKPIKNSNSKDIEKPVIEKIIEEPYLINPQLKEETSLMEVATDKMLKIFEDEPLAIENIVYTDNEVSTYLNENLVETTLNFKIKLPKSLKVLSKKYDKNFITLEKTIIDLEKDSISYLKTEIENLKIDQNFIENLKSNKIDITSSENLEIRVAKLEKKVSELEEFFIEMFQGMLIK